MKKVLILTFVALVFVACGVKNNSSDAYDSSLGVIKSHMVCSGSEDSKIHEVLDFSRSYLASLGIRNKKDASIDIEALNAKYRYIKISEEELISRYENTLKNLSQFIPANKITNMKKGLSIQPESSETSVLSANFSEVNEMFIQGDRWVKKLCSFRATSKDRSYMKEYLLIKDSKCQSLNCLESLSIENLEDKIQKICEFVREPVVCKLEYDVNKKGGTLEKYFQKYFSLVTKEYERYFQISHQQKLNCIKENNVDTIHIKVQVPKEFESRFWMPLSYSGSIWSNEKLQIRFDLVRENGDLEIELVSGTISHYSKENGNKIFISKRSLNSGLNVLLAHELGHYLGFPDCYIEYFSKDRESLHYLEIAPMGENIMCTLQNGAEVPDHYFKQLKQRYCR